MHDVAPQTWDACEHLLAAVTAVASIPITLLVVPDYHGAGLRSFSPAYRNGLESRLARGDELALHGWRHLDDEPLGRDPIERLRRTRLTAREGEFAALPVARARERLEAGLDWFGRFGWPLHGFVAPAWLMSPGTWQALDGLPFGYVTTRPSIYLMPQRLPFETSTLVYSVRTSWRRALSLLWNEALRQPRARAARGTYRPAPGRRRPSLGGALVAARARVAAVWTHCRHQSATCRAPAFGAARSLALSGIHSASTKVPSSRPINAPASTSVG